MLARLWLLLVLSCNSITLCILKEHPDWSALSFYFYLAAAAVVVALAATAQAVTVAAAEEQENQDDDPPAAVAAPGIVVAHKTLPPRSFRYDLRRTFHVIQEAKKGA